MRQRKYQLILLAALMLILYSISLSQFSEPLVNLRAGREHTLFENQPKTFGVRYRITSPPRAGLFLVSGLVVTLA